MLKNILLPVDLDHEALWTKALPVACSLAERHNASLHVLTIVPDFGMSAVSQYFPENYREETMERELAKLNAFVKEQVPRLDRFEKYPRGGDHLRGDSQCC